MSRLIAVLVFSIMLVSCSSQEKVSETVSWTWIFENGTAIEFPNSWELGHDSGFYGVSINDGYGELAFTPFGYDHDAWEQIFFEQYDDGIELETNGNVRIFRAETVIETLAEHHNGITEFVDYVIFTPNDFVLGVYVPVTPEIIERELIIQQVLESITVLHDEFNIFSFHGGQAVMTYSDDWEIVDRNLGLGATMRTNDLNLIIAVEGREFWQTFKDEDGNDDLTHEDIIYALSTYNLSENVLIQHTNRHGHHLAIYEDDASQVIVFRLNNGLWFRGLFARGNGSGIQPEDELVILQMIDSILLNNRNSYYEPINLALP